ncbi:50S ribosomal protein L21 [Acidobacteria bacterium AH-259-D05]|nr:50S ribosomal protein L21 [Acidobacteria bacterium AH-259-D05]
MYAIIESGGKQYRVNEGDLIDLERFGGQVGEHVNFDRILLVGDETATHLGTPLVPDGRVVGTIAEHGKQDKIVVFKFKRRKGYKRKQGHRQLVTTVRIDEIGLTGKTVRKRDTQPAEKKSQETAKQKTAKKETKKAVGQKPAPKATTKKPSQKAAKKQVRKKAPKKAAKKTAAAVSKDKSVTPKRTVSKAVKKKTTKGARKTVTKKDRE